jgi:hypothetical protein
LLWFVYGSVYNRFGLPVLAGLCARRVNVRLSVVEGAWCSTTYIKNARYFDKKKIMY